MLTLQLLTTLAPTGTKLAATLYYPAGQAGSTSVVYKQVQGMLTAYTTKGSYTIFQGTITQPADTPPNGGGSTHVDVSLGTLKSLKAQVGSSIGKNLFTSCSKTDLTTCP